ncbi:MAG: chemotaxis protein CheV, partial [Alphaproteobacteria bacterium]|nr:chemotaxis protein CheV [Alphaproteobacteria bacterium]
LVSRIDEIYGRDVQNIYGQHIFHHRDQLTPIIDFEEKEYADDEILPILIFADRGYKLALCIDEIVNIIEDSTEIQLEASDSEILGTAIIKGAATSIIDCQAYFRKAYPQWSERQGNKIIPKPLKRLLLIDDSTFFLNLISPLLKVSGYVISTASSADQALHICRDDPSAFDAIISDIEMPDKTGYDFLSELREDTSFDNIPVVALSGCDTDEEIERCRNAGFRDFVPKTDQQALIRILNEICSV